MNNSFKIFSKYRTLIFFLLFSLALLAFGIPLYKKYHGNYITIKFMYSGPLYKDMPVYYKGYNIGQVKTIWPNPDYKYTFAKITLFRKDVKLPDNITAKAKKLDTKNDYIDLLPPDEPSSTLLKKGSVIKGEAAFDLDAFLSDIADSGIVVPLLQHFSDTVVSFGETSVKIGDFFTDSRTVVKENKPNIEQTTKQLNKMSKSLNEFSTRLNQNVTDDKVKNTTSNVEKSSDNLRTASESVKNMAASFDCATRNIDQTIGKLDCTLSETTSVASNLKTITCGIKETLGKRFAGLRLIFGKPLNNSCAKKCPKKCPR